MEDYIDYMLRFLAHTPTAHTLYSVTSGLRETIWEAVVDLLRSPTTPLHGQDRHAVREGQFPGVVGFVVHACPQVIWEDLGLHGARAVEGLGFSG